MILFMPVEFYIFFGLQLPATILLGLLLGVVAIHVLVVDRGRMSLRAMAGIVLIAALESAVIAQNPPAWTVLLIVLGLATALMELVDLAVLLSLDQLRPEPHFGPRVRRWGFTMIGSGLIALSFFAAGYFKYFIAINPEAASWLGLTATLLGLLLVPALVDLLVRVLFARVRRRWTTTGG